LLNVDRFTSNQGQKDHQLILRISSNTFHQRKCFSLADRTNGRAYAIVLRLSVVCLSSSVVCDVMYCG